MNKFKNGNLTKAFYAGETRNVIITLSKEMNKDLVSSTYKSSDKKVVTVTKAGKITAKKVRSGDIKWRVSNRKVATINNKTAKLTAKKVGTTYVITKVGSIEKKIKLIVR